MLLLPLKPSVRYDLAAALAKWLDCDEQQVSFQPTHPLQFVVPKPDFRAAACRNELVRLQSLRNDVTECFLKAHSHKHALEERALEDAMEYHAVLLEFEKRGFPTLDDPLNGIRAAWKAAWPPHDATETHGTLVWERMAILYNVVALWTEQIKQCRPTDREASKQAVSYCQNGASVLAVLRELIPSSALDLQQVELSLPHLLFWERYLIAHAQTSIYRMAALNPTNQQHATLAVLAQASYSLYNEALLAAQDPRLQSELTSAAKEWATFCKAVSMLQAAKAAYHQSVVHRLVHEYGKEIYWLRQAVSKLQACNEFCHSLKTSATTTSGGESDGDGGIASYTHKECLTILPIVKDRLTEIDQDNYKIYQDAIPTSLPDIVGKQLAKYSATLPASMVTPQQPLFVGL